MRERARGDDLPDPVRVEPGAGLGGLDEEDRELVAAVAGDDVDPARLFHEDLGDLTQGLVADRVAELVVDALEPVEVEKHDRHGDRKSTRLNSSHLVISYAVFCLKKKNHA